MSKVFYLGFFMFVTSTVAFIVAILTPFWILKTLPNARGIFETCDFDTNSPSNILSSVRRCQYILLYSDDANIQKMRQDYAIACASLAIIASSLSIIYIWIAGFYMCIKSRFLQLRVTEVLIAGTLLIDCITVVIWVVMLAKNLDNNNVIATNQIGWSLWLAVGSTGGFLLALVLFCIHRIDIGASPYSKRHDNYAESREYLQRF